MIGIKGLSLAALAIFILLPLGSAVSSDSTVTGWQNSVVVDITTTQAAYSDSWKGGEVGSFNWVGNLNGSAENQLSPSFNYKSTLKLSFGQTMTQNEDGDWSKPRKSTDLIDWENVGRFTLHKLIDPYAAFRLESQFVDASFAAKKLYLNPVRLTESAGLARRFWKRDKDHITSRFGLALRQIITRSIADTTALTTESTTATDGGFESVTDVSVKFNDKLQYTGKLTLFKALFFSEKDKFEGTEAEDYWKAVDVNWENIVTASITKIITVNFYTQVLYDKEVSLKGRFKETLGIGFVFKML